MPARYAQREPPELDALELDEALEAAEIALAHLRRAPLDAAREAVALDAGAGGLPDRAELGGPGRVGANDERAVVADALGEGGEGRAQALLAAVVVEMVGLDVGDERELRLVLEEGLRVLVGLDNGDLAATFAGVAAQLPRVAAEEHERVELAADCHQRDERGGRGLAVAARNGEHPSVGEQALHHLGADDDLDAALAGGFELRVRARRGHGRDDELCAAEVGGGVALVDGRALRLQAAREV